MPKQRSEPPAVVEEPSAEMAIPQDMLAEMEAAATDAKREIDLKNDIRLPVLKLVQATTQDTDANPGQLVDSLTMAAYDEVDIVPITMFKTRAFFGSGSIGDAPTCSSQNALDGYGEPGDGLTKRGPHGGGDCQSCPQANWRTGGKCQLRYNYLALLLGEGSDIENELPRGVMMHGTSAKVASRLNSLIISQKFPWSSVVALGSAQEKNERGTYKVWEFAKKRPATQQEMIVAFQLARQMASARDAVTFDEPEATEATTTAVAGDSDIPF